MSGYSTHIPILAKCISIFGGNVLEFGTGMGSSPLLCTMIDGELCSFESNIEWYTKMKEGIHENSCSCNLWTKPNHSLHYVKPTDWDSIYDIVDWKKNWSIAFIDHAPAERRVVDIIKLKNLVDVIIYHDSEEPGYGWRNLDGHFNSVYVFDMFPCQTTVLSNKYNLKEIL